MPRTARRKSKTGIYHLLLRGINKQTIFEDEEDCERFLQTLLDAKEKSECKIYAYCLMGNHIQLLIHEGKEDLGITMRRIGASYVYWYNWKYDRFGHLFQDRYKSEVVEDDKYLLTVLRYINQNPIKANIVKDISEYKWSSYNEYLGKSRLVDKDFILDIFSIDRKKAILDFKRFHKDTSFEKCLEIENVIRLKDEEAKNIIKKACNLSHCKELQNMKDDERDKCLNILKDMGISTRQISRLTGLTRYVVMKS